MTPAEARHERKMARLRRVAEVYNGANEKPASAVSEALGVKATTARTLIFRAREAGLIGAYEPPPAKWRTEYAWVCEPPREGGLPCMHRYTEETVRSLVAAGRGAVYVREVTEWRQES